MTQPPEQPSLDDENGLLNLGFAQIEGNGLMHMTGFFPSVPEQVNFDLAYAPVNGQWRLFGISVGLAHTGPGAPPTPPPPAAKAKVGEPKKPGARDRDVVAGVYPMKSMHCRRRACRRARRESSSRCATANTRSTRWAR